MTREVICKPERGYRSTSRNPKSTSTTFNDWPVENIGTGRIGGGTTERDFHPAKGELPVYARSAQSAGDDGSL